MPSHPLSIALVLTILLSSRSYCSSRLRSSIHERREDLSDDLFADQDGNEDLPLLWSVDGVGLPADQNLLFQDGSSNEDLNNLGSITVSPSEEIAQGSSCEQSLNRRDDLISGKYEIVLFSPCSWRSH